MNNGIRLDKVKAVKVLELYPPNGFHGKLLEYLQSWFLRLVAMGSIKHYVHLHCGSELDEDSLAAIFICLWKNLRL